MKKLPYILTMAILMITGCHPKKLDKKLATELIIEKKHYPNIIDYDVFCNDPVHAYHL